MDQVTSQLKYYCVMESSFYTQLEEAGLVSMSEGESGVAIALASRDICSVSSFLKKGQSTLDTIMNEYKIHNQLCTTQVERARMLKEERLVLPIEIMKLRKLREELFLKWHNLNQMMVFEFTQNNYRGGGLRGTEEDSLGLLLTRLQAPRAK